ncbi:MAG: hydantoinase B/oxoprolinase family protein [Acetobacteraceae bacterium]
MSGDPVLRALAQNRLDHLTRQMGHVMTRTARSPIFAQAHDFSCFLADGHGAVVAQADGIPIHTGSGGFAVRAILRDASPVAEGDVFLLNDPYLAGGNHLPDWVVSVPAFAGGRPVGFACVRAHQSDIGGGAAGTYNPDATEIFHEGIRLPVLRLAERGAVRDDLWRLLLANTRTPDLLDGDLRAMIGAARIGAAGMARLAGELGAAADTVFAEILAHAEALQRAAFRALPPGTHIGEETTDTDARTTQPVLVRAAVTIREDGSARIDFTGSSPQLGGFKNSPYANTVSAVGLALAAFFDPAIPRNEGRLRCVEVLAPEGSCVNPRPPAPVTMCTVFLAHEIIHAVWRALGRADPARAPAGWAKNLFGVMSGRRDDGTVWVGYHAQAAAGAGAVRGRDGFDSIGHLCTLGGLAIPNVETTERDFPVRVLRQEFRCDSAGAGQWRGGSGVHYAVRLLADATQSFRGEGIGTGGGYGVAGGGEGAAGSMAILWPDGREEAAPRYGLGRTPAGTELHAASAGGGGWGDPRARDPAAVLADLLDGIISPEAARSVYAVATTEDGRAIDEAATRAMREEQG